MYREFLLPIHTELAREIDCPVIVHICGDTADRVAMIAQSGVDCFHWDTASGSAKTMRGLAGEQLSLMGGISNVATLVNGTPEDVTRQVNAAIDGGVDIIGPECAVPLDAPLANLKAIVPAVKKRIGKI